MQLCLFNGVERCGPTKVELPPRVADEPTEEVERPPKHKEVTPEQARLLRRLILEMPTPGPVRYHRSGGQT